MLLYSLTTLPVPTDTEIYLENGKAYMLKSFPYEYMSSASE